MEDKNINIEKILDDDAKNIYIDKDYKEKLKHRIMAQNKVEHKVEQKPLVRYLKVASIIVFFVAICRSSMLIYRNYHKSAENSGSVARVVPNKEDTKLNNSSQNPTPLNKDNTSASKKGENSADVAINSSSESGTSTIKPTAAAPSSGNINNTKQASAGSTQENTAKPQTPLNDTASGSKGSGKTQSFNWISGLDGMSVVESENIDPGDSSISSKVFVPGKTDVNVVESDGSINIMNADGTVAHSIQGRYPSLYQNNGKSLMSYVKEEVKDDSAQVEEKQSTLCVYDINGNSEYELEKSDISTMSKNISTNRKGTTIYGSKYTYLCSYWSKDGSELYAYRINNETGDSELLKLTLNMK